MIEVIPGCYSPTPNPYPSACLVLFLAAGLAILIFGGIP